MSDELPLVCHGNNPRPTLDENIRREAATKLVNRMIASGTLEADDDRDDCISDIVRATRFETDDGFRIATQLERECMWDCDMAIAEEMANFRHEMDIFYKAREKKWAEENPHEPIFKDGDHVLWRGKPATIGGVVDYRPQYYKVYQGDLNNTASRYYIVPFEDVVAAQAPAGLEG